MHHPSSRRQPDLAALTRTFRSSRTFHPYHSLLGRLLRWATGDRLRGEATFILTLTGLALLVLIAHYLGWALLQPVIEGDNTQAWQMRFWFAQIASVLLLAAVGLVGFRPPVTAHVGENRLTLDQGKRSLTLSVDEIEEVSSLSAQLYHLHYRHYAATHAFIGTMDDTVLLLRTADGPVVVALPEDDQTALAQALAFEPDSVPEEQPTA